MSTRIDFPVNGKTAWIERRRKPRTLKSLPVLQEMELEHAMLRAWQARLRTLPPCEREADAGSGCSHVRGEGCTRSVMRLAEDMLFFLSEHFALEDAVMHRGRAGGDHGDAVDKHREDHATIMQELVTWLGDAAPCRQRRVLHSLLHGRFARHLQTHDEALKRVLSGWPHHG